MGERDWSFQSNGPSEALKPRTFFPCSSWTDWRCPAPWTPWNPTPAPVSIPSLLLPIPAIVFIAVGVYLLLLGLVLLIRHCLLAQGCCTDCSSPCRKPSASERQDCCWTCAEACDFPLPSPALCLDACCPQPTEAGWAPHCPHCCPLCDCACACQLPDCQSLNCLCFEIKLR
ncbi:keratin-associated protein 10-11 isoform X3 [Elephas maximus indicus]|uniref:keratin-associated protein 10-11 isoform X3 n=1 Tax=Elephas maximus indicus TaxID=99487 RepID=UPI00211673F4|nr:keratin-associated protein 10-11 isoform X3 [Elephas maximus indicus]